MIFMGEFVHTKNCRFNESQDDQHKEAELGELKSLMSDEYFRVGIPDGYRGLSHS